MNITETVHAHLPAQYADHPAAREVVAALVERERTFRQRITEAAEANGLDASDLLDDLGMEAVPEARPTGGESGATERLAAIEETLASLVRAAERHGVRV